MLLARIDWWLRRRVTSHCAADSARNGSVNLFSSQGVDLPTLDGRARARPAARRFTALFDRRVLTDALVRYNPHLEDTRRAAAADYARKIGDPRFLKEKEVAVRPLLITDILQVFLGYRPFDPAGYDLAQERAIGGGQVDVALGAFGGDGVAERLVVPFELKGPRTADLDRVDPGRGRSPVQQAWDYAVDAPGARWVLVSNGLEIRLYAFGRGRDVFQRFDLAKLDDPLEQDRLYLLLAPENLLGERTERLLRETDTAYQAIGAELYADYRRVRDNLIGFLRDGAPALPNLQAIEAAQKLLDRVLFIAFAQRTDLLPDRLLEQAKTTRNPFSPQPLWFNFTGLFQAVDKGRAALAIPRYNGGLFAPDPVVDALEVPEPLAEQLADLGAWDYRREVPVTVLGRIFEQSITDIERLKDAGAPAVGRRKREGVVYTPDSITRFLVERTLGVSLDATRGELWRAHAMESAPAPEAQAAFWRAYLDHLRGFTVVDPACGSGAFLVAAYNELARRYIDVEGALLELGGALDFDWVDEIVTRNLHGVDVNAESVEITRLSLWLKTARRDHPLQRLERTVRVGNSLIDDPAASPQSFDWGVAFPEVFAQGGFDAVIGNPPYVRMELIKPVKPWLTRHYAVADERTDLYAYFFERGLQVLKPGGRLGFISSSTFFRTGSGRKLRALLNAVALEAVVDFGDVQLFEGVTTYPAILTLQKAAAGEGALTFLSVTERAPEDLGRAFAEGGRPVPRARLSAGSWSFDDDAMAVLRAKITAGRPTLGEVYGAPLYGIKTGLNKAFVITGAVRDRLIERDGASADLLKPFLRGENIKRWRVESEDLWLINTPKGRVDIDAYPAVRDWLLPFKPELEARATKQEWWELQQAQFAYQQRLGQSKISYPHFQNTRMFTFEDSGAFSNDKSYFIPTSDMFLLGFLNSKLAWYFLSSISPAVRAGWHEMRVQYVEGLPLPSSSASLASLALAATRDGATLSLSDRAVAHRISDLDPRGHNTLPRKLQSWSRLDFRGFMAEVKKAFGTDIPLKQRGEWEVYLAEQGAEVRRLTAAISAAEVEIDRIVYGLFDLTPDEVVLLEGALAGRL